MRILADENIERAMVNWLRNSGQDVEWVMEEEPSSVDSYLVQRALDAKRVLLTKDTDFGFLVFREKMQSSGIILLRIHA